MSAHEAVIGLEVHVQLDTRSKLFCACPSGASGAEPNAAVCPVCTGQPGVLPVLNRRAVELAFVSALALRCRIRERSVFARKNYFYPDLPKGYQISQFDEPFAEGGSLRAGERSIGIHRIHLEEDAGKLLHAAGSEVLGHTRADFNRAGTPLIEIVSEPDLRSPDEACEFLQGLKAVLQYCGVSRCDMEKGELRCDANVSVRREGERRLGVKVEVKNLNSFRHVRDALAYEHKRQSSVLEEGGSVEPETRLWDEAAGRTEGMRSKEEAHDYRYFPEPDLVPLLADEAWLSELRRGLPELPEARKSRLMSELGLSAYDAGVLTSQKPLADYFEAAVKAAGPGAAKPVANWISSGVLAKIKEDGIGIDRSPVGPEGLAELVVLVLGGTISGKTAKDVFSRMWTSGESAARLVRGAGLEQVSDEPRVSAWVDEAIRENPKAVQDLRAGKKKAAGALVGSVMRKSGGKANPSLVNRLIKEKLT